MRKGYKPVPAIEKCFSMLDLFVKTKHPLGISDISRALDLHKSTVFNILYTLVDLGILEQENGSKFRFGTKLYLMGKAAGTSSELISTVHPYLDEINRKTKLTAFLGMRSGLRAIILDKVDSAFDIKISSEIGMRIPLLAGAGGKVLLAQLPDDEIEDILSKNELKSFTRFSCTNKKKYLQMIQKIREEGIAVDKEEYIEGICALAVPLGIKTGNNPVAIWAVGLKRQLEDIDIPVCAAFLKEVAMKLENRFSF
ncbi:MAG: IclR family transcriptional regulator [Thermodesulfobacteriota bacterium]